MQIEFDPAKDTINQAKHGSSLSLAELFELDIAIIEQDTRYDYQEVRMVEPVRLAISCMFWRTPGEAQYCVPSVSERQTVRRHSAMTSKRKFHIPSEDEDAAITAAALSDPDNPPLTDEQLSNLRPARQVLPGMIGEAAAAVILRRPGRPTKPLDEHKVRTTMRLDPDVLAAFKETGPGWQSRVNDALRDWAKSHRMLTQ